MKLYIDKCKTCKNPIPLKLNVRNRAVIRNSYGDYVNVKCPTCNSAHNYTVYNFFAKSDSNSIVGGGVVGGIVGLLGGPIGVGLGLLLGGTIGNENDSTDRNKVESFNSSL